MRPRKLRPRRTPPVKQQWFLLPILLGGILVVSLTLSIVLPIVLRNEAVATEMINSSTSSTGTSTLGTSTSGTSSTSTLASTTSSSTTTSTIAPTTVPLLTCETPIVLNTTDAIEPCPLNGTSCAGPFVLLDNGNLIKDAEILVNDTIYEHVSLDPSGQVFTISHGVLYELDSTTGLQINSPLPLVLDVAPTVALSINAFAHDNITGAHYVIVRERDATVVEPDEFLARVNTTTGLVEVTCNHHLPHNCTRLVFDPSGVLYILTNELQYQLNSLGPQGTPTGACDIGVVGVLPTQIYDNNAIIEKRIASDAPHVLTRMATMSQTMPATVAKRIGNGKRFYLPQEVANASWTRPEATPFVSQYRSVQGTTLLGYNDFQIPFLMDAISTTLLAPIVGGTDCDTFSVPFQAIYRPGIIAYVDQLQIHLCLMRQDELSGQWEALVYEFLGQSIINLDFAIWGDYYVACWDNDNALSVESRYANCHVLERNAALPRLLSLPKHSIVQVAQLDATASPVHGDGSLAPCGLTVAVSPGVLSMVNCEQVNFDTSQIISFEVTLTGETWSALGFGVATSYHANQLAVATSTTDSVRWMELFVASGGESLVTRQPTMVRVNGMVTSNPSLTHLVPDGTLVMEMVANGARYSAIGEMTRARLIDANSSFITKSYPYSNGDNTWSTAVSNGVLVQSYNASWTNVQKIFLSDTTCLKY
jgi:hypothetical protein